MVVERFTVVVFELMIALPRALWREVVWSGNHTHAAYLSFQGECGHGRTTTLVAVHAETGGSGPAPAPWIAAGKEVNRLIQRLYRYKLLGGVVAEFSHSNQNRFKRRNVF
jgi:hypothetical protein